MSFIIRKFGQIDLRNKNWLNDPRIGFKSLSSLVDFIETDVNLQEELEEFKSF
jgi:hypothetical protein